MSLDQCHTIKSKLWPLLGSNTSVIVMSITLCLCPFDSAFSQQFRFKNYSGNSELGGYVVWVSHDARGFMWFVQEYAVTRFDGHTFKKYQHTPGDTSIRIGAGRMEWPAVSPSGELWINNNAVDWASGYVVRQDWNNDGFSNFIPGSVTNPLYFDRNEKKVWFGSNVHPPAQPKGLFCLDIEGGRMQNYMNNYPDSLQKQNNWIGRMADHDSVLLMSTENGLWMFNKERKEFYRPHFSQPDSAIIQNHIPLWAPDASNNQWMFKGPEQSLIKISPSYKILQHIKLPERTNWHSVIDNEGYMWFISPKGLMRVDSRDGTHVYINHVKDEPYSLPTDELVSVGLDREGNLWVAHGEGVSRLLRSDIKFYYSQTPSGVRQVREVNGELIIISKFDQLWSAPIQLLDSIELKPIKNSVKRYDKDAYKDAYRSWKGKRFLWLTVFGSGFAGIPLDPLTGRPDPERAATFSKDVTNINTIMSDSACAIWEDEKERVWVGTFQGLNVISLNVPYGQPGSVKRYVHNAANPNSIGGNTVRAILPEDSNSIWVVTETSVDLFTGDHIEHVLQGTERITSAHRATDGTLFIGTRGGLYEGKRIGSKYIFNKVELVQDPVAEETAIAEDKLGRIWVLLAERGMVCYDRKNNSAIRLDESDGLFSWPEEITTTSKGIMVVNNGEQIAMFDPLTLKLSKSAPLPFLTKLEVNNRPSVVAGHPATKEDFIAPADITALNELRLDYLHNNFTIEFSSMEMAFPEKNMYQHQLVGYDEGWIQTDFKNRRASYTNLSPGTYQFKVRASNYQGAWSDKVRTLDIVILPPPWRTWWAYIIYSVLFVGLLVFARGNIVQRERLKANLQLEHVELEKAKEVDKVKTSFFTNISHEFRTPLTLIKGPVQNILERYTDDPKLQQQLKLVERNSDLLLKLINQLLDLAKLDSGNLKVEKSKGDVIRFIKAASSSFSSLAAQKNISIHVDAPTEPLYAFFDRDKLETILINLINNAIKFTPPYGTVQVNAESGNGSLLLRVKDTGIGIPADQQEKIFERFHQVSESHKEVGTGIGLALVKELVSLLGGTIAVKSEVGKGSEFIVTLPLEIVSPKDHIEAHEPDLSIDQPTVHVVQNKIALERAASNGEETRPHVLVVEDNADLRSFIIESLGEEFHFLEAENGKEGLNVATTEIPDLIISDVMMPEMDGITMAEKIKGDVRTSHIPLILLTAKSTEASKLTGLESGADDYLTKPFNKHELLLKIRNGISRQRKLREKVMAELMSDAPRKEVPSADEQFLTKVKEEILKQMSNEQLSVESLAEQIGMSRVHLYRKISGLTGMSVNELIRKLRLHRAAQLLQQQWGPVSQVAYEVGFSNLSYFSKVFKEEFGILPSAYATTD